MPSVGMRRSTRVFVPKTKEGEVVRVLRSGRRLWVKSSGDGILKVGKGGEQWLRLIDSNRGRVVVRSKENGWNNEAEIMEIDDEEEEKVVAPDLVNSASTGSRGDCVDKMYGKVYSRKRKKDDVKTLGSSADRYSVERRSEKMYQLQFMRRQKSRRICGEGSAVVKCCNKIQQGNDGLGDHGVLSVVIESSCAKSRRFATILVFVLRRMTIAEVGMVGLSAFLMSKPISHTFASCGINFFWNSCCIKNSGFCKIYGARQFIPLFSVNFSAVPVNFVHLHARFSFRTMRCLLFCSTLGLWMVDMKAAVAVTMMNIFSASMCLVLIANMLIKLPETMLSSWM
ncbi:hypothetical protein Ancab_039186 [Ancistrocladus abbreviatus]